VERSRGEPRPEVNFSVPEKGSKQEKISLGSRGGEWVKPGARNLGVRFSPKFERQETVVCAFIQGWRMQRKRERLILNPRSRAWRAEFGRGGLMKKETRKDFLGRRCIKAG